MSAPLDLTKLTDKAFRLSTIYHIVDKEGQRVRFEPNPAQAQLRDELHGKDVILKARQMGFTTFCCIDALDDCMWTPNFRAAIIAHRLEDAKTIFETKVKFPYDNLPEAVKAANPLGKDSADTLHFKNGSSISVTTSARSGTLQRLHVSEFGKICAQYPQKAREIITGSLPAAEKGRVTIESTAEGQEGRFYEMCRDAQERAPRSQKEWRFHFFPWWEQEEYRVPAEFATITEEDAAYFDKLKRDHGIALDAEQKAWWVLTERDQGGDMKREYPSTAEEAFEQAIEGAIFATQIAHAAKHGRIGDFPFEPRYPVNSFWDLGRNDMNTIWLHQHIGGRNRFIGYYENSGEYISHYVDWLREWAKDNEAKFDEHYLPHDGKREDLFLENGRLGVMDDLGFSPTIVDRVPDKWTAVETARSVFATCDFDEAATAQGMKRLRHYRKEWDDARGVWKNRPLHDENSHGADGFMTFSTNYSAPKAAPRRQPRRRNAWAA